MPFAKNLGVRIAYAVRGRGPPLILHHGFCQSSKDWQRVGYVDALARTFQLIVMDARGHGDSDKPHDRSAYAWPVQVFDVVAVLDRLDLPSAAFWGYSMGGEIGFALALYMPERVTALLCGGASGHGSDIGTAFRGVDGTDKEEFLTRLAARVGVSSFTAEERARLLANDLEALAAAAQNRPSLEHLLQKLSVPCFLYTGSADTDLGQTQDCARRVAHATCMVLPGLTHGGAFDRADLVLPSALDFLQRNARRTTGGDFARTS